MKIYLRSAVLWLRAICCVMIFLVLVPFSYSTYHAISIVPPRPYPPALYMLIELSKVPQNIQKIAFSVTIHEAEARAQNFGQVANAYIRILNNDSNEELIRYDLSEDFSIETAVVVGELYRNGSEWKFNAIGSGFRGGLYALCQSFGINIG